ncbi:hypothetical protein K6U06_13915 [Acidiferrimicrobium sp. IK]|uniref:hypothetical protein n=1 Tax=Acidiferrimicrobium sp. IK TaxID=2871700 RepID=UPI0021CB29E4|nr:hypothetical protein [Acidiferrimicrobium sp. IK]MCU4185465.1 hypothetical protein [Acidiferrimicrobium sp. IK]
MTAHDPLPDLPLLAAIAEGEDVGDRDFAGRAEATLRVSGREYQEALARLIDAGLVGADGRGAPTGLTAAGRARLRPRSR